MPKPLRTLNKRRRRAEKRAMYSMYITTSNRVVHLGGDYYEYGNECWKWRTGRSYRSRRPKPQGIFDTIEAIHEAQTYIDTVRKYMNARTAEGT